MDDVVTEAPPPSRFSDEDLDTFLPPPAPPLPSPFLLFNPNPNPNPPTHLLLVAISPLSRSLLHRLLPPSPTPLASLFLPEIPLSAAPPHRTSFHLYSPPAAAACLASVQCAIPPERSRAVAKCLLAGVNAHQVLIFDCIKTHNHRGGRIEVDRELAFKLETNRQRSHGGPLTFNHLHYLPSGSVVDGLGAAILTQCQMKGIKATLLATWPQNGGFKVFKMVFTKLGFEVAGIEGEFKNLNSTSDLDLYT